MSQLPKLVRDRLAGASAATVHGSHPDADLLTAFVEGALSQREREQLLSHLAACADCRDVVALSTPEFVDQPELQVAATPAPQKKWWNMSSLRWASVSATAVIVLAAALLIRPAPRSQSLYTSSERVTLSSDVPASMVREEAGAKTEDTKAKKKPGPAEPANENALVASDTGASRDKLEARQQVKGVPQIASERSLAKVAGEPAPPQRSDVTVMARRAATPPVNAGAVSSNMVASAPAAVMGGAVGGSVALDHEADRAQVPAAPTKMVASAKPAPAATSETQLQSQAKQVVKAQVGEFAAPKKDEPKFSDQVASARAQAPVASKQAAGSAGGVGPGRDAGASSETAAGAGAAAAVNGLAASGARSAVEVMATPTSIVNANLPLYRWTIDRRGKLERSSDGKTWEVVPVAEGAKLLSLAVLEREIWTGGAIGLLYHSDDAGNRWTRVRPAVGDTTLEDDITRITVPSPQHISLTTSSGHLWTSSDGGKTWRKQ
jgi:Photosynthesis system II assembly factor YCF48/Putative zinc-finger